MIPMSPIKEDRPSFEGIARTHPIVSIVLSKGNRSTNDRLPAFLEYEYYRYSGKIPFTLSQFYQDYTEYVMQQCLNEDRQHSLVYSWNLQETLMGLSRIAFIHYVSRGRITSQVVRKNLLSRGIENIHEYDYDLEFRCLGILTMIEDIDGEEHEFIFNEAIILEYLVAYYLRSLCLAKLLNEHASKIQDYLLDDVLDAIDALPVTGDIWRIVFGLLNIDDNTRTLQPPLLYEVLKICKNKEAMNSFDVTSFCVETIYESQNAGNMSVLLDEFTLNQSINYANAPISRARYLYAIQAVGYLVRASPNVYGVHLNNFGLNEDRVALLADPVNDISDNNLQVLNISNNPLGDGGVRKLQRFIVKASLLTHLDISSCDVGSFGISLLSEFFMCLPLRYLRLSDNHIGDKGMINMSQNFRFVPTLEWLDVSCNNLTDNSMVVASREMKNLKLLRCFDLRHNRIGELGMTAISQALQTMPQLADVFLAENKPGDASATVLAEHAWKTKSLRHISMNLSQIPQEGILSLKRTTVSGASLPSMGDDDDLFAALSPDSTLNVSFQFYSTLPETQASAPHVDLLDGRPDKNRAVSLKRRSTIAIPSRREVRRSWHGISSSFRESFRKRHDDPVPRRGWESTNSVARYEKPVASAIEVNQSTRQPQATDNADLSVIEEASPPVSPIRQANENGPAKLPPTEEIAPISRGSYIRRSLTRLGANIRNGFRGRFMTSSPQTERKTAEKNATLAGSGDSRGTAAGKKETLV